MCSTPEGIEAAITGLRVDLDLLAVVLNARRHRSGDHRARSRHVLPGATVLNARRHRSGDHSSLPPYLVEVWMCSTPEGIEAAITGPDPPVRRRRRLVLNARRHRSGDHSRRVSRCTSASRGCSTPEGIEAAITRFPLTDLRRLVWCSTPEGIEAAITSLRSRAAPRTGCAQRPKASKRRSRSASSSVRHRRGCAQRPKASKRRSHGRAWDRALALHVLNARRHRSGDHPGDGTTGGAVPMCSTPEGIEAAITDRYRVDRPHFQPCSTPEGIEAAITRALPRGSPALRRCAQRPKASKRRSHGAEIDAARLARCSTPEGIEAAITGTSTTTGRSARSAQRPKASKRRSRSCAPAGRRLWQGAQRPKASKRRSLAKVTPAGRKLSVCSTPEGIEAAITAPRGGSAPRDSVLNARRHRSGDHR